MGIWDHIYKDSIFTDDQHSEFDWFELNEVSYENSSHIYMIDYNEFFNLCSVQAS